MNEAKPFWASKTVWVNGLTAIFGIVNSQIGWLDLGADEMAALLGIVNLVLRATTKGAVTLG